MRHRNLTGAYTHHLGYYQATDPELLGDPIPEGMAWIDKSGSPPYPIYVRNATDDGWNAVGGSGTPTGAAGGDLSGSFPNPSVINDSHTHTITTISNTELAALAALDATAGILVKTAANTYARRTLTGAAAGITVTNGSGASANPTLVLANDLAGVEGMTGTGIAVRTGTDAWTAQNLTITRRVYTATSTWTKPTGLIGVFAEVQSGGGGSGAADGGVSLAAAGGGGGGGGYCNKYILASALNPTETATVGAGGTAGATTFGAGAEDGGTGGTSSFSTLTALGGHGGAGFTPGTGGNGSILGGAGGTASGGNYNIAGDDGGWGVVVGGFPTRNNYGGGSHLAPITTAPASSGVGSAGGTFGGGASGGSANSATDRAGNVGGAGVIIITEYTLA